MDTDFLPTSSESAKKWQQAEKLNAAAYVLNDLGERELAEVLFGLATDQRRKSREL